MNNMRKLRKACGLTMKELGRSVGVAESTISLYETGKHEPDIQTMLRIAAALGVSVDELLGDSIPVQQNATRSEATALMAQLTDDELALVLSYAEYIKSQRK